MTAPETARTPDSPTPATFSRGPLSQALSRRDVVKWFTAGAGAAAVGGATWLLGRDEPPSSGRFDRRPQTSDAGSAPSPSMQPTGTDVAPASADQRVLVVIEMAGGNDGMSMLVPYGLPGYYDLRPDTAIPEADVLRIDDEVGWHPSLQRLQGRGAAIVQGVGSFAPDASHFEMRARWWQGSPESTGVFDTGVLGRLADAIGDPQAAAVALSVSDGAHPLMISRGASTLTIPSLDAAGYLTAPDPDDDHMQRFQRAYRSFSSTTPNFGGELAARRQSVMQRTAAFADAVGPFDEENSYGYRDDRLGGGLRMAAHLFSQDLGLRIVHITMDGDFDTHEGHNWRYPELMAAFDESVDAFLREIADRGLSDRVLIATMSEFGRTAEENDSSGLDHGQSAPMLLLGPVNPGRFGEHPSLANVEQGEGLPATVGFDSYYATIAEEWFGVPASEVANGNVEPVRGIFA